MEWNCLWFKSSQISNMVVYRFHTVWIYSIYNCIISWFVHPECNQCFCEYMIVWYPLYNKMLKERAWIVVLYSRILEYLFGKASTNANSNKYNLESNDIENSIWWMFVEFRMLKAIWNNRCTSFKLHTNKWKLQSLISTLSY